MSEQQSGEKLWAFCNVGVANSITYRAVCVLNWENIHSKTAVIIITSRNMFTFSYLYNPFLAPKLFQKRLRYLLATATWSSVVINLGAMCENEKGAEWVATNPEILFLAVVKMLNGLFSIYGQQLAKRTIKRALRLSSSHQKRFRKCFRIICI